MLTSGLRSLLTIGPGPDDGGSKLNQRPHMPDKSGMDVAFSLPPLGASVGTTASPKTGVAAAAASVATKRKSRRCKFMLSSHFLSPSRSSRIKLSTLAWTLEMLPSILVTRNQVELMQVDNVCSAETPGFAQLGILPHSLEEILQQMLWSRRSKSVLA